MFTVDTSLSEQITEHLRIYCKSQFQTYMHET